MRRRESRPEHRAGLSIPPGSPRSLTRYSAPSPVRTSSPQSDCWREGCTQSDPDEDGSPVTHTRVRREPEQPVREAKRGDDSGGCDGGSARVRGKVAESGST